jgi:hypothetical protein
MMNAISLIPAKDLRRAAAIKERIEALQQELSELVGANRIVEVAKTQALKNLPSYRKTMSAEAKARIVAGQKKRWAKWRKEQKNK